MVTDAPPRKANYREGFHESDRIKTLDLPQDGSLLAIARSIESAMKGGSTADVRRACAEFVTVAPQTMLICVWMKTAVRKEITSFGTFLSTLCHEFCHHLDYQKFGFRDS